MLRTSGVADMVPIIVPENLLPKGNVFGKYAEIRGSVRSYHNFNGKTRLVVFVYPHYLRVCDKEEELLDGLNVNKVSIVASIEKANCRKTPLGRTISDVMVRINRENNDEISENVGHRVEYLEEIFKHRGMHEFKKVEFSQIVKQNIKSKSDITPEITEIINQIKEL